VASDDLLLRIDADTASLDSGIARANKALGSYESAVRKAQLAAAKLDHELEQEQAKAMAEAEQNAERAGRAMEKIGTGMVIAGGLVALGVGKAIAEFADFDAAMSSVQAANHETAQAMGVLREAALQAGADTKYSATEAAGAEENLAKAGLSTADIVGGALTGALNLAAAGQLDVASAAEFTATALTQFGLAGDQAGHVADVLAAGAGKAQGEVSDMATALNYAGLPAHALGISLEETAGTLALFAKNGLIGEQAGTTFRGVLASLQAPSQQAKEKLAELGVTMFDANGKFVGLADLAGQLHDRLGNATDAERSLALGVIFGNQQLQGANILVNEGAHGVAKWTDAVDDSGYAAKSAAIQMDNLKGDLEKLRGAIDTALIQGGSGANDVLREVLQTVTFLVDKFGEAPPVVQKVALGLGVVGAAGAVLAGGALILIPRLGALATTLDQMALAGGRAVIGMEGASVAATGLAASSTRAAGAVRGLTSFALGPWGLAIGAAFTVAAVAMGGWLHSMAEHQQDVDSFTDSLDQMNGSLTEQSAKIIATDLSSEHLAEDAKKLGLNMGNVADIVAKGGPAYDDLIDHLRAVADEGSKTTAVGNRAVQSQTEQAGAAKVLIEALENERGIIADSIEEWRRRKEIQDAVKPAIDAVTQSSGHAAEATETLTERTDKLSDAQRSIMDRFGETADAAVALSDAIDDDKDALDRLNGVNIDAIQAQINYQSALQDSRDALAEVKDAWDEGGDAAKEMGRAVNDTKTDFDLSTEAGRKLKGALIDQAQAAKDNANATYDQTTEHDKWIASLQQGRTDLINEAKEMGLTQDAAEALADQILAIPEDHNTTVTMNIDDLVKDTGTANANINGIPLSKLTKLEGDPSGLIAGVNEAQDALDGLHDKTVNVYLDFKLSQEEYLGGGYDDGQGGSTYGDRKYGDGGKSFGQQSYGDSYGDSYGSRFGPQSLAAMAGTRSQQVGGDQVGAAQIAQAFAAALNVRAGHKIEMTFNNQRAEDPSRVIARNADAINFFAGV
jgi:TP901 family phage tail tape measure protein